MTFWALTEEQKKANKRAAYRSKKRDAEIRPEPSKDDPVAHAAWESGGILTRHKFKEIPEHGCGKLVNVAGTNEGKMPCGAKLRRLDGSVSRYYCAACDIFMKEYGTSDQ